MQNNNTTLFKFKDENILSFNRYTNELLDSILAAKSIALNKEISTLDLTIGLIIKSKLLQKILGITEKNILNIQNLIAYDFKLKQNKNIILKNIWLSKESLILLKYTEWTFELPNTIGLFYCIYIFYYEESIKPILKLLNKTIRDLFININENYIMSRPTIVIPNDFINIINTIKFEYTAIVGRKKEGVEIINILDRTYNRNPIIIGEHGLGKSKLIEKIAFNLNKKVFVCLDIIKLIKQSKINSNILYKLIQFIEKNPKTIIVATDIEVLFDTSLSPDFLFFINKFIEALKYNKIQLIGTVNLESKYNDILTKFYKLKFLVSILNLKELSENEIIEILEWESNELKNKYKINLNCKQIEFKTIYKLSKTFIKKIPSPIKEIFILDSIYSKYKLLSKKNSLDTYCDLNITKSDIIEALMNYTTLPASFINTTSNSSELLNKLNTELHKRIFGQENSIKKIVASIKRAFTGLKEKNKPIGSWLLCGPSGTGKTELVKSLAEILFGSESDLIRFDMSEFKEAHDSVKLIGCPPGYVGYDKGGILTSAVKEKPYSVILFDEIEKAHPNVNDLMLQLLDEGTLTDSYGEKFDFSNTIIIFTSNLGCPKNVDDFLFNSIKEGNKMEDKEYKIYKKNITYAIKNYFRPELLNRLTEILIFNPLTKDALMPIADKYISNIQNKLIFNNIPLSLEVEENYLKVLIKDIFNPLYGARPLKRKIEETIENPISEILSCGSLTQPYKLSVLINKVLNSSLNYKNEVYYIYSPLKTNLTLTYNRKEYLIKKNKIKNFLENNTGLDYTYTYSKKKNYYIRVNTFYSSILDYNKNYKHFKFMYDIIHNNNSTKHLIKKKETNVLIEKRVNTIFHIYK